MAFVVGQGVISLLGRRRGWKVSGQGVIAPYGCNPPGASGRDLKFCFVFCSVLLDDSARAFETVFFSRPKRLLQNLVFFTFKPDP